MTPSIPITRLIHPTRWISSMSISPLPPLSPPEPSSTRASIKAFPWGRPPRIRLLPPITEHSLPTTLPGPTASSSGFARNPKTMSPALSALKPSGGARPRAWAPKGTISWNLPRGPIPFPTALRPRPFGPYWDLKYTPRAAPPIRPPTARPVRRPTRPRSPPPRRAIVPPPLPTTPKPSPALHCPPPSPTTVAGAWT